MRNMGILLDRYYSDLFMDMAVREGLVREFPVSELTKLNVSFEKHWSKVNGLYDSMDDFYKDSYADKEGFYNELKRSYIHKFHRRPSKLNRFIHNSSLEMIETEILSHWLIFGTLDLYSFQNIDGVCEVRDPIAFNFVHLVGEGSVKFNTYDLNNDKEFDRKLDIQFIENNRYLIIHHASFIQEKFYQKKIPRVELEGAVDYVIKSINSFGSGSPTKI
ncbi:MAG: hypothetical protein AAF135_08630, partial [Bacteroidota bacterium]